MTDVHQLTGAYATDALDDLERARFEKHLADCEDCRAEVAELREAAVRLAEITAVTPPASLRSSVLEGIAQVRPLPPVTGQEREPQGTPAPSQVEPTGHEPGSRRGPRRWVPLLVAAVLALVAGVALNTWQPWAPSEAEQVLEAADAERVQVDLGPAGSAEVVRSKSEDRAVIVTDDMVAPPEGQVYQLWLQPTGTDDMLPAGLMPPGEDNIVVLDGSASDAGAVGITVEPEGGSEEPSGPPIALFDLTQAT